MARATKACPAYKGIRLNGRFTSCTTRFGELDRYKIVDGDVVLSGQGFWESRVRATLRASGATQATVTTASHLQREWGTVGAFYLTQNFACRCTAPIKSGYLAAGHRNTTTSSRLTFKLRKGEVRSKISPTVLYMAGASKTPVKVVLAGFRCDRLSYLGVRGGCVYALFAPTWAVSRKGSYPHFAAHVAAAQKSLRRHWGSKARGGRPLTRTRDAHLIASNRARARAQCRRLGVKTSCDEYSFASTSQGCAAYTCHVAGIPGKENSGAGSALNGFYRRLRIKAGDNFWVRVVG